MASNNNSTDDAAAGMGAIGLAMIALALMIKFGLWAMLGIGIALVALSFWIYKGDHK